MRIKILFTQLLFLAAFSLQVNAQTTDLVKYLPENATMIMDIDGASLSQKLSWKELMAMKMFDSLLKKADPATSKMIAEPSETGINFSDHLYLVMDFNEGDEEGMGSVIAFYGKVQDETRLNTLLNKATIKEVTKKTSGENKMFIGKDFVFGWNKSVFVLHAGTSLKKGPGMNVKQTTSKKELARLEKKCNELLTPRAKNIYATNKHFENLVNEKADMRIWIEMEKMNRLGKGKNPFSMFGISGDYQGKYKTAIVNFENGKIISKGYTYYNDDVSASVQKMYPDKLNTELIKKLPPGNLMGLFAMSFKPDAINEMLEKTGIWEEFKKMKGGEEEFDPGIILDNLKGDILFSVSMPDQTEEMAEEEVEKDPFANMQIYMAATVKDEKRVNKLIDSLKLVFEAKKKERDSVAAIEEKMEVDVEGKIDTSIEAPPPMIRAPDSLVRDEEVRIEEEEIYTPRKNDMFKNLKPVHKVENGVFVFSLSDKHLEKFGASTNTIYDKIINEYGDYPMLMTIDLKTILSLVMTSVKKDLARLDDDQDHEEDPEMYSFFEVFDKWVIAGGKFNNGAMQTMQEIKFSSPDENSLKQIMKMFDLIFQAVTKTKSNIEIKDN